MKLDEKPSVLRCTLISVCSGVRGFSYIILQFDLRIANPCASDLVAGLLQGARVKTVWDGSKWFGFNFSNCTIHLVMYNHKYDEVEKVFPSCGKRFYFPEPLL